MRIRRTLVPLVTAVVTTALLSVSSATASPYNETCGDGTPHGCISHCLVYHGGVRNLHNCLWGHYLV